MFNVALHGVIVSTSLSSPTMSALALANPLEPFFPMLWHFHAAVCLTVAGTTLFLYDWAITFSDEVEHIWRGRINTVKSLYLYNRIVTPLILAVDLYDKGGLATNLTPTVCKASLLFDGWGTVLSFASIHWIVALRVWTLYGRSRAVLYFFILLFGAYFISTAIIWGFAGAEISKTIYPSPLLVRMCYTVIPSWMWYLWIPSIGFETIIFVLTVYKAWQHWQTDVNTPILTVLYRDGFLYFFVISCLSLVNLFIWLWAPHSLAILLKYFSLPVINVAAFRLVLDLRTTAGLHSRPTLRRSNNKSEPIHISFDHFELSPRGGNFDNGRSTGRTPGGSMAFLSFDDHVDPSEAIEEGRSMSLEHENPKQDIYPPYDHQALHGPRTAPLATSSGFQPLHDVPHSAISPTRHFIQSPTSPLETDGLMSSSPMSIARAPKLARLGEPSGLLPRGNVSGDTLIRATLTAWATAPEDFAMS
ncbi:hypothetical protein AURDEDRAFT_187189 [Auricularia subglabra TFB-10046 SS5]|nr:hypothetical protein AURDEDRAFT_187189 [Auricularia subglabra TFB-10046 SS5]